MTTIGMTKMGYLRAFMAACSIATAFLANTAAANGRFPAAGYIAVDPGESKHIVSRTTYGLLTTRDGGENWDWICEQAVPWTGQYDPSIAMTADGTLIAGIYDRLGVAHGDGCTWTSAAPLVQKNVVDVSTERAKPDASVLITSTQASPNMYVTQLWESPDNAKTWTQAGADMPMDFGALTVDVAPSDPMRVYVSGIHGGTTGAIERSLERGKTWERIDIPGSDQNKSPFIAAIDPTNPDKLYVRLNGAPGKLLVSSDGAQTWTEIFSGMGVLKGFALSPDGSTILVGGETDGIWRASSADYMFTKVSEVGAQCLTWSSDGVYACAAEFKDKFTIGLSKDEGATFSPIMHLSCVRGPLACDPATSVGGACPAAWPATADVIDQASCFADAGVSDAGTGAGEDAGPTGNGGNEGRGCNCRAGEGSETNVAVVVAMAFAAICSRSLRSKGRRGKQPKNSDRSL